MCISKITERMVKRNLIIITKLLIYQLYCNLKPKPSISVFQGTLQLVSGKAIRSGANVKGPFQMKEKKTDPESTGAALSKLLKHLSFCSSQIHLSLGASL